MYEFALLMLMTWLPCAGLLSYLGGDKPLAATLLVMSIIVTGVYAYA